MIDAEPGRNPTMALCAANALPRRVEPGGAVRWSDRQGGAVSGAPSIRGVAWPAPRRAGGPEPPRGVLPAIGGRMQERSGLCGTDGGASWWAASWGRCCGLGKAGHNFHFQTSCTRASCSCLTCNNSLQPCETDLQACQADSPHFFGDELDAQVGVRFSFRNNNDGTFTDLNTGLIWEQKNVNNQSINRQFPISVLNFDLYSWYTAVAGYLAAWNDVHATVEGEWRFPTVKELLTLVDYSKPYVIRFCTRRYPWFKSNRIECTRLSSWPVVDGLRPMAARTRTSYGSSLTTAPWWPMPNMASEGAHVRAVRGRSNLIQ